MNDLFLAWIPWGYESNYKIKIDPAVNDSIFTTTLYKNPHIYTQKDKRWKHSNKVYSQLFDHIDLHFQLKLVYILSI